mmetsp:Transcript_19604/g.32139  ORF Transcript_19604/g.32139 Transcript_19604/m.32139 type:complete len:156 (+) Transcript_19604:556-1023(+)
METSPGPISTVNLNASATGAGLEVQRATASQSVNSDVNPIILIPQDSICQDGAAVEIQLLREAEKQRVWKNRNPTTDRGTLRGFNYQNIEVLSTMDRTSLAVSKVVISAMMTWNYLDVPGKGISVIKSARKDIKVEFPNSVELSPTRKPKAVTPP